jgi:hypothetical protein
LQLLGLPVQLTASKLQDLSTALDGPLQLTAQLVQHHPALLNLSPAVLRSRLFAIAQAQGCNCRQLLSGLDQQQLQGLSGLLLLSPGRLTAQLQGLEALLRSLRQQSSPTAPDSASPFETQALGGRSEGGDSSTSTSSSQQQQHARVTACRLLLRLGTRSSLAGVQVTLTTLQGIVRTVEQWQLQLAAADDCQLAHLLSAGHQGLAQAKFLAAAGCVAELTLVDVVLLPPAAFNKRFPGYQPWLSGNVSS